MSNCASCPRIGGGIGTMSNWRVVSAILGSGVRSMGGVPEGQRSGKMSYTTSNKSASFCTLGEEDSATFEAIAAGRTFEDIQAMMAFRLLVRVGMWAKVSQRRPIWKPPSRLT